MKKLFHTAALVGALISGAALAQTAPVEVDGAWARASTAGRKVTGVFMRLTAKADSRLVGVESPVAGSAEVHAMKLEDGIMKMRALPALDLPAGQTVELKPGSYHVMLLDLKAPLVQDSTVPITLVFQDAKAAQSRIGLSVPVRTRPAPWMGINTERRRPAAPSWPQRSGVSCAPPQTHLPRSGHERPTPLRFRQIRPRFRLSAKPRQRGFEQHGAVAQALQLGGAHDRCARARQAHTGAQGRAVLA